MLFHVVSGLFAWQDEALDVTCSPFAVDGFNCCLFTGEHVLVSY